jgi:hypothetical protein
MIDEPHPILDARIDELQRILRSLEAGEDVRQLLHDRLDQLQFPGGHRAAYEDYQARWLNVPGDHAPGRCLDYATWRKLAEELAQLISQTEPDGSDPGPRSLQLSRALLLRRNHV